MHALIFLSDFKHTGILPLAGEVAILWRGKNLVAGIYLEHFLVL